MKINRVEISYLLSFGKKQIIDGFARYNLIIGENGSGKTNFLKIISGLELDYNRNKENTSFTPSIQYKYANLDHRESGVNLQIKYKRGSSTDIQDKEIEFVSENANRYPIILVNGDIKEYSNLIYLIKPAITDLDFFREITTSGGSPSLLNYSLFYIFNKDYKFYKNGAFMHGDALTPLPIGQGDQGGSNYQNLPSGVYSTAKILSQILYQKKGTVILIDEIEKSLEPKILRRFLHLIIWMISRNLSDKTDQEEIICRNLNEHFKSNLNRFNQRPDEKLNYDSPNSISIKQIFFSSHSPILIDELIILSPKSSIYKFKKEIQKFRNNEDNKFNYGEDRVIKKVTHLCETLYKEETYFSEVTKLETHKEYISILYSLGCKGSDILQTNGVVWVEGPSDVIYIQKWLKMYANEFNKRSFIQGRDYEFQMYGGTLLDSLCLIKTGLNEENELKKLVSMFSFSRNAFIVTDSDAVRKADGKIVDQSKFKNAKNFIKEELETLQKDDGNRKLGIWYKQSNTEIRTMESYLDAQSKKMIEYNSWTKKIASQKITESWDETKKLEDFPNNLKEEIKLLYDLITEWNK